MFLCRLAWTLSEDVTSISAISVHSQYVRHHECLYRVNRALQGRPRGGPGGSRGGLGGPGGPGEV